MSEKLDKIFKALHAKMHDDKCPWEILSDTAIAQQNGEQRVAISEIALGEVYNVTAYDKDRVLIASKNYNRGEAKELFEHVRNKARSADKKLDDLLHNIEKR